MIGPCQHNCSYISSSGYCSLTACINPKFNGSGTYIVSNHTLNESGLNDFKLGEMYNTPKHDICCIIETCPKCGGDLTPMIITTYPPIRAYKCNKCGYYCEGSFGKFIRVPLDEMR